MSVANTAVEDFGDRRRIRRVTDEQILNAAATEFSAQGFAGASMQAIATGARTTKATIYANLGDKERLYTAVLEREAQALRQALLDSYATVAEGHVPDQLRVGTDAIFRYAAAHPAGFRLLLGTTGGPTQGGDAVRAVYDDVVAAVSAMVAPRLERVGVTDSHAAPYLAAILVGMFQAAATATAADATIDPAAAADAVYALASAALAHLDPQRFAGLGT